MAGQSILATVEDDLRTEFEHAHVQAHITQFVGLFVGGFLAALIGARFQVTGWDALAGLAAGAAGAAVRQMWPQINWSAVLKVIGEAKAATAAYPPASSSSPSAASPPKPTT